MATLMEKDVLLEMISYSLANLHKKYDEKLISKNVKSLAVLKRNLLCTDFDKIDFEKTKDTIKAFEVV